MTSCLSTIVIVDSSYYGPILLSLCELKSKIKSKSNSKNNNER